MATITKRGARRVNGRANGREMREIELGELPTFTGYAVKRAQEHVFESFMDATPDENITPARFAALTIIGENENLIQSDLADCLGIARSGVTAMLKALHDLGYVAQNAADNDRRAVHLSLTPAGRIALEAVTTAIRKQDDELTASFTAEERATLISLLQRFYEE